MRRRHLQHVNLLTEDGWKKMFYKAGFRKVEAFPYLFAKGCRLWDMMDFLVCIGMKGFTVGGIIRLLGQMMPVAVKKVIYCPMAKWLSVQLDEEANEKPCAILILARK